MTSRCQRGAGFHAGADRASWRSLSRPPFSTIPEQRVPSVVLVAPSDALSRACHEAMRFVAAAASIEITDVAGAATNVARWRPFALVMEEEVFEFDPREFEALARDVGAEIVTVASRDPEELLTSVLLPQLKALYRRWDAARSPFLP